MSAKLEVLQASEPSLFDSLARLVPEDLRAEYYRVLAHTRTLSPNDEMLRILEAMGILTLLTRTMPNELAAERERLFKVFTEREKSSTAAVEKMRQYLRDIETRVMKLPEEITGAINAEELANLLSESIRQEFVRAALPQTAQALQATTASVAVAQETLTRALEELCHRRYGVLAQVESANSTFSNMLEGRAKRIESLFHEWKSDMLRIWIPMVAAASILIGLAGGLQIQGCKDSAPPAATSPIPTAPAAPSLSRQSKRNPRGSKMFSPSEASFGDLDVKVIRRLVAECSRGRNGAGSAAPDIT